jgi:hypothetical protein
VLVVINPEPSEEERAAIVEALDSLIAEADARPERTAEWWAAGVRENLEDEDPTR